MGGVPAVGRHLRSGSGSGSAPWRPPVASQGFARIGLVDVTPPGRRIGPAWVLILRQALAQRSVA